MLLSVIIPAYNDGKYISKALKSVYDQSFTDFEVIIINDGSTDNTAKICEKWVRKFNNIKMINQKNKGSSIARQTGIITAEGDYCLFLDAGYRTRIPASRMLRTAYRGFVLDPGIHMRCRNSKK